MTVSFPYGRTLPKYLPLPLYFILDTRAIVSSFFFFSGFFFFNLNSGDGDPEPWKLLGFFYPVQSTYELSEGKSTRSRLSRPQTSGQRLFLIRSFWSFPLEKSWKSIPKKQPPAVPRKSKTRLQLDSVGNPAMS